MYKKKSLVEGGKADVILCINRVTTGDYNILIEDATSNGPIVALVIERKTWKDLAASFKDGRTKTQHAEMLSVQDRTGCKLMYLIEGRLTYTQTSKVGSIPFANLDAKRRHLILRGISLIQTRDQEHTAKKLGKLARDMWRFYQKGEMPFLQQTQRTLASYMADLNALNAKYRGLDRKSTNAALDVIEEVASTIVVPEKKKKNKTKKEASTTGGDSDDEAPVDIPDILTERKIKTDEDLIERMGMCVPNVTNKSEPTLMADYEL